MPARVSPLSETQIVADLLRDHRRNAAAITSVQMPQPAKDTFTVAASPATTYTLTAIPYQGTGGSSLNLSLNGVELVEGVDYTVDYTTAIVTVTATLKGTPTPADVLMADYWTTGDLIALTGTADSGLGTATFNFVDSGSGDHSGGLTQDWVVPASAATITVEAYGAQGTGDGTGFLARGGNGGYIKATFPVTPGETLRVFVGGRYNSTGGIGGWNGGGGGGNLSTKGAGGGGGTDIRRSPYALADRLVIGGGGGGAGGYSPGGGGGTGHGGAGGYTSGASGQYLGGTGAPAGAGGTQSAGGAAGGTPGSAGSLGQGGPANGAGTGGVGAGGGGGGYYGGGAGQNDTFSNCAGGGGGSSGCPASGGSIVTTTTGARTGDGLLVITYPL